MSPGAILDILRQNNALLKKHHVKKIGLFGSHARGEESPSSDVDLLVEFDEASFGANYKGYFDAVSSLSGELSSLLNKDVDLVTLDMLSPHLAPRVLQEAKFIEGL